MTWKQCTVFVADDDKSVLESLALLLESAGYQSRGFGSAEELLASGSVQNACCLILDIKLPGMSGLQLLQVLAASHTPIPVVFITGHDCPGIEAQALGLGAVAYLRKPFDEQMLLDAIHPYCVN
ncbi:response regulator transcription factor [Syntrophobacter fumaroxidans]|uniref:Response regulator receiver protein n=1 Tax=Syntrophobacter fumaroxidans (strain DSM 10017 / MPOB) TaxID=335543 RepID=A0LFT0_SYNFM|nr:response regulator [Syntrophobacter fumaroxidans]ABK16282.1 response regulator receiver protein [Syntrophobacter fumaroxidans MPOB]